MIEKPNQKDQKGIQILKMNNKEIKIIHFEIMIETSIKMIIKDRTEHMIKISIGMTCLKDTMINQEDLNTNKREKKTEKDVLLKNETKSSIFSMERILSI
jgi:hypothetical protein